MSTSPAASFSPPAPTASDFDTAGVGAAGSPRSLSALERRLLDDFQRDFPLVPAPFAEIGARLGVSELEVIDTLSHLEARGCVSRVGPVFAPCRVGYSLLAALSVPAARVDEVAALVNAYPEVNHNYEREHDYNLWFVITGDDERRVERTLDEIERRAGLKALRLPLERAYHIDLGFPLWP
ncbi:MAG TPA: Lrp/AsnC family transcriptional regulator [Gammaproteobacteria bacterium]|nr:Lrp/AsnC family transcriptional regulator [Gammaproteobacteria bacterium]